MATDKEMFLDFGAISICLLRKGKGYMGFFSGDTNKSSWPVILSSSLLLLQVPSLNY